MVFGALRAGGRVSRLLLWSWAGLQISGLFCPATIHSVCFKATVLGLSNTLVGILRDSHFTCLSKPWIGLLIGCPRPLSISVILIQSDSTLPLEAVDFASSRLY